MGVAFKGALSSEWDSHLTIQIKRSDYSSRTNARVSRTKYPQNREVIFPYIGGDEINNSPTHSSEPICHPFWRYAAKRSATRWPSLMKIVEENVKPQRLESAKGGGKDKEKRAEKWWQILKMTAKELYSAMNGMERVLAIPFVSKWFAPAFVPCDSVVALQM